MPEETVGHAELADCTCGPCRKRKGERYAVPEGTIHSYSSEPRGGWRVRRTGAEMAAGIESATFGVELETTEPVRPYFRGTPAPYVMDSWDIRTVEDQRARDRQMREFAAWQVREEAARQRWNERHSINGMLNSEEAVSLAAPRGFWHSKHDSSVSGPEFASQPASLAYWRSQRPAITGMMKALLHGGMRSHDGDTCGMHINIGTDTFGTANYPQGNEQMEGHLFRFVKLMTMNQRWTVHMSQRTNSSMNDWARFGGLTTDPERQRWAHAISVYGYCSDLPRYMVLNAANGGRIECRIPRGTLRVDRFYAKLEWLASMIEYTRDPLNVVRVSDYMRWVERSGEYPTLVAYMRERFHAERFADAAPDLSVQSGSNVEFYVEQTELELA